MNAPLVEVRNVSKIFRLRRGVQLHAVQDVSFTIQPGEILGLVGESGCGKSTLGRLIIRLHKLTSGEIRFAGDLVSGTMDRVKQRQFCRDVQLIFQDPYSSLNPRMTVRDLIAEGPDALNLWTRSEREAKVCEWLERVGLSPQHGSRYPHEFSGGQRQRIGIARALAVNPKLVICDEPISALDVSVQAQIINLLRDLRRERGLTYLFIAHDLNMVRILSDRMAVMYLGRIVEMGPAEAIYKSPVHPYSQALIAANPIPDPEVERSRTRQMIQGEVGSPINPKAGCLFAPRCPLVHAQCHSVTPLLRPLESGQRWVACHAVQDSQE